MKGAQREPKSPKLRRAQPVRELLQKLLREKLKTAKSKQELASYLGLSTSAVEAMIYHGQGGLDAWIGALMHCYQIEEDTLPTVLALFLSSFSKSLTQDASDQAWCALQSELTAQEKLFWVSLIEMARQSGYPQRPRATSR